MPADVGISRRNPGEAGDGGLEAKDLCEGIPGPIRLASRRVINFAHGAIGAFAAASFGVLVVKSHAPYYLALPLVAVLGGGVGVVTEVAVMRRLRRTLPIVKVVATIGFASFLAIFSLVINSQARFNLHYPEPPYFPAFNLGPLHVGRAYTAMLVLTPLVIAALAWFVQRSRYGIYPGRSRQPRLGAACRGVRRHDVGALMGPGGDVVGLHGRAHLPNIRFRCLGLLRSLTHLMA
jgi:branched-subunit amino acid ABC-type transport system permease component